MNINIEEEKKKKEQNFKEGLKGFLEEYQTALNTSTNNFERHSENCGNQARKIAEAFCRYRILVSSKSDSQKENEIKGTLGTLHEKVTRSSNAYIEDERERNVLKKRLNRILDIGNEASYDNDIVPDKYDLDEIKNTLLFLSDLLFGKKVTESIVKSITVVSSESMSKENISITINGDIKGVANAGSGSIVNQTFR